MKIAPDSHLASLIIIAVEWRCILQKDSGTFGNMPGKERRTTSFVLFETENAQITNQASMHRVVGPGAVCS